jgi:two-component sensor histidine kinase
MIAFYNLARVKQFEEVKASYETEKKDQQLLMKDKDLVHTRLLRNLFIGGAVLLVLLLALLFNRYNLKRKSNRLLQKLVAEKEWLMKEVHHRVKNNLQIVISLLNMQAHYLKDELTLQAFGDASHRIRAISLIHQKLYQEENMAVINMPDYIRELVSFLSDASQGMHVHFVMDLDPVELDASQSVPVGLIINEAITNAFKYAFTREMAAMINISFKAHGNQLQLSISDNGRGLPAHFDTTTSKTLGFQLMNILSEQLDGHMSVESSQGVLIRVSFEKTTALQVGASGSSANTI